nr:hypothetical protein [Tanacetum cinerariifolium]
MSSTFANTHNMVAILNKSEASEGFDQIIDVLNGSYIQYALTVNPHIYVSCIKQFWKTVTVKQSNDVTRLQALVDRKKSMSAKRTSWNEFSLAMASALFACLQVHSIDYPEPTRVGKGCSGVETPLFEGMLVAREHEEQGDADEQVQGNDNDAAQGAATAISGDDTRVKKLERANKVKTLKLRRLRKVGTSQRIKLSNDIDIEDASNQERMIAKLDRDTGVALMVDEGTENKVEDAQVAVDEQVKGRQAEIYQINMDHALKVLSMQEDEPEVQEAVEVVTTAKLITEVVAAISESVSAASATIAAVPAATITAAPVRSKDKGKGIMVEEPKPIKKKQQVEMDEAYARNLHEELNQDINWDVAIDHSKEQIEEEENRALESINKTPVQKAAKRRKLNEEQDMLGIKCTRHSHCQVKCSHWQYKFPLPVKVVATARRLEMPLTEVCTAIEEKKKKLPVKDRWQLH